MTSPAVATPRADDTDAWWRSIRDIRRDDRAFVFILTILAGVIYWATNPARVELDGFVPLADALLHGKLYGSINNQDIAEALGRRGITIDKHKIDLEQPIKSLGTYKVAIKVMAGMTPEVTIVVEPKG